MYGFIYFEKFSVQLLFCKSTIVFEKLYFLSFDEGISLNYLIIFGYKYILSS